MKLIDVHIERIRRIGLTMHHLEVTAPDKSLRSMKPGQTLLARPVDAEGEPLNWDPYLRDVWWPVGMTGSSTLLIERPASTSHEPGRRISLLGPVGMPYALRQGARNILLIAHNTSPTPLTVLAPWLARNQLNITLVLTGEARAYPTDHLPPETEIILGDESFNWQQPADAFTWADQAFIVAPQDNELTHFRAVIDLAQHYRIAVGRQFLYGVVQSGVVCGTGACMCCAVRVARSSRPRLACVDGPAFDLSELLLPEIGAG